MKQMGVSLVLAALVLATALPAAEKADRAALVRGNNQFALELYGKLRGKPGNLFFSPYSLSTALAMAHAGARGQTAEEMVKTLHFNLDTATLHPAFASLSKEISGGGQKRGYQLSTANALWGQQGYSFRPEYLRLVKENYGPGLNEVDFAGDTETARKTINTWVEKETNNKIKELLKPGILNPTTRLTLTNAIYFKGDWASQFKKDKTREGIFQSAPDKKIKVPLMSQPQEYGYLKETTVQVVEMPYVGKELSMVVLLPKKVDGLAELEKTLTADRLSEWLGKLRKTGLDLTLPKFKLTADLRLDKVLREMGMARAFTSQADFSGINGGKETLFIQAVVHQAFVEVSEEGTEAAAATAVSSGGESEATLPEFRADHPFVFLIRDKRNDSILFLGRVVQP